MDGVNDDIWLMLTHLIVQTRVSERCGSSRRG
jgi:hypothetical protein